MPEHCRFQEIREGRIYCGIWDQDTTDTYRGETNKKLCESCVVPENQCKALSVRTHFSNEFGRPVYVKASCEMKKKKIKLPEDCSDCADYTF